MGRVSVPFWLVILSDQLPVKGLVGFYPANNLIGRRLISKRLATLTRRSYPVLLHLSVGYPRLKGRFPRVTQPFAAILALPYGAVRIARLAYLRLAAILPNKKRSTESVDEQ